MEQQRLDEYIKSYQQLFEEKGYGEAALGSGVEEGELSKMVRIGFTALSNENGEADVSLRVFGFFGETRERIGIAFRFRYDQQKETIDLKHIIAQTPKEDIVIVSRLNSSFPTSQQLYDHVLAYRERNNMVKRQPKKNGHGL